MSRQDLLMKLQGTHKKFGMEQVCQMASNITVLAAVLVVVTSKRVKMRHVSSLMYLYRKACVSRDCFLSNGKLRLAQAQKKHC